jgi:hypothetical protein
MFAKVASKNVYTHGALFYLRSCNLSSFHSCDFPFTRKYGKLRSNFTRIIPSTGGDESNDPIAHGTHGQSIKRNAGGFSRN